MKKQSQSLLSLLIALALVLISCRLLTPAPAPGADVEQSAAQTVAARLADETEDTQPLETPEPSAMMIDEDAAQPEGMGPCQLVFVSDRDGVWDILALDFNTRQLWQLTAHDLVDTQLGFQDDPSAINVSVSPDGERIAFNSDEKITQAVYVMNQDGSELRPVGFNLPSNDAWPSWSADGALLAFQSDREGEPQVYVMDLEGEIHDWLLHEDEAFIYPAWSPAGGQIAMVSGAGQDLYLHDIDSGQLTRLTEDVLVYGPPAWSPDGERLVVSADEGGLWNIYVIEVATGFQTQLTEGSHVNRFPAWSPDGNWIAFSSERDGQAGIYLMPAEGGEVIRLTDHDRQDLAKAWLPGCADELPGLLAGWDRDAPLVAGDPVPAIPGPGEADPVDPPTDDPVDPPADDPVDPPADDPFDPPAEDEATTPEVTGNPIIDVVLDWARRIGQRVGLIPIGEGEQVSTVWDDLLGLLGGSGDDPVGMGTGRETTPIVTPDATPTTYEEEETEETPEPDENAEIYGPTKFSTEVDIAVPFHATNCDGLTGEFFTYLLVSEIGTSCSGVDDACGYRFAPVEPNVKVELSLPERSGSGPCESESECDWYSDPFDFSYTFIRRGYDCECDGVKRGAAVETWSFDYINARLVIHSHIPGVITYATIMVEEVVHNMTHSHPDVPDVVDVSRQGVETEIFPIIYDNDPSTRWFCEQFQE